MAKSVETVHSHVLDDGYLVYISPKDQPRSVLTQIQVALTRRKEYQNKEVKDMATFTSLLFHTLRYIVMMADALSMENITTASAINKFQTEVVQPLANRASELNPQYQPVDIDRATISGDIFIFYGAMVGIFADLPWLETLGESEKLTALETLSEFANAMACLPSGKVHKELDQVSKKMRAHGRSLERSINSGRSRLG